MRLVLDRWNPDPRHRLLHPVQVACVLECAAIEERLVALVDSLEVVVHRTARDLPDEVAGSIEGERERSALRARRARGEPWNAGRAGIGFFRLARLRESERAALAVHRVVRVAVLHGGVRAFLDLHPILPRLLRHLRGGAGIASLGAAILA